MEGKRLSVRCRPWHFGLSRGGGQGNGGGGVQLSLFEIRFDIYTTEPKKLFTHENNISMLSKTMLFYTFVV